jgi:hypothetical protein
MSWRLRLLSCSSQLIVSEIVGRWWCLMHVFHMHLAYRAVQPNKGGRGAQRFGLWLA